MLKLIIVLGCLYWIVACTSQPPVAEKPPAPVLPKLEVGLKTGADSWMLAATCFACHGPQGRSLAPAIPSLAGLSDTYFINLMQAYQYGGRYSSVMGRIALAYDKDEILLMARYFSQQEPKLPYQRVDWTQVRKGRQLHNRYCRDCHGDLETKADEDAVSLHGQWLAYLRWTLQDYLVGINQTKVGMSQALASLVRQHGVAGLEALIQYYGSARP